VKKFDFAFAIKKSKLLLSLFLFDNKYAEKSQTLQYLLSFPEFISLSPIFSP